MTTINLPLKIIQGLDTVNYDHNKGIENTSPWRQVLILMDKFDPEIYDKNILLAIARTFANRILKDRAIIESTDGEITECSLLCPSWGSHYDKLFGICSIIAPLIFPKKDQDISDSDHEIDITADFSKLLTFLRKTYKAQSVKRKYIDESFRVIIDSNKRQKFNELKQLPVSDQILHPTATIIEDPSLSVLMSSINPLIHELKSLTNPIDTVVCEKGTIYPDGRLDLCFQNLDVTELQKILEALGFHLQNKGFIKHILLGNNNIGDEGAKILAEFIAQDIYIRTWYICACNITHKGIEYICDAIKDSNCVESLWLKRNPLSPTGIKFIGDMLKVNRSITLIDLCNTAMLDEGCEYLFDSLNENKIVESLYIGSCGITQIGAKNIALYFDRLKHNDEIRIKNLYIDVNRLDDQGVEILCKSLCSYPLERFSVGSNRLSDIGIKKILDTFVDSKSLIFLDIGSCKATIKVYELPNNPGDLGVGYIVKFLRNNRSVQIFNARHVGITSSGFGAMYQLMNSTSSVYDGDIPMNNKIMKIFIDQAGVKINSVHSIGITEYIKSITTRNIATVYECTEKDFNQRHAGWICHGPLIKYVGSQYISSNAQ